MAKKRNGGGWIEVGGEEISKVLTESTEGGGSLVHNCGTDIIASTVDLAHRFPKDCSKPMKGSGKVKQILVPFCPNCEYKPTGGIFYEDPDEWHINAWEQYQS